MLGGTVNRILFVDLSTNKLTSESPDPALYRDFLGGYGIGARVIFSHQKAGVDPLGPDNMLGFIPGILTGTPALLANRYVVAAKSPLTGCWGDANSGGDFGPYLKFAGYDAVFFSGAANKPVYLLINDGVAQIKNAAHLWGKDVCETEDILKAELGKEARIACIGPSGEQKSLLACIVNNKGRVAGRCGLGAVMGSKKLKAIAVIGTGKISLADEVKVEELRKKYLAILKESKLVQLLQKGGGTAAFTANMIKDGEAPVKNWAGVGIKDFPNYNALGGDKILANMEKKYACWRCPVSCGGIMKEGIEYKYPAGTHKPEYESIAAFGCLCLNDNAESTTMASDICNRYGLDTISVGTAIAFAIECYENGLITKHDTDGLELRWGNHQAIVAMTEKIAKRQGFGAILADGSSAAARHIGKGAEKYAMNISGQEPAMHDPKNSLKFATGYAIDAAPGRHTQGGADVIDGKEQKTKNTWCQAFNSAGLCQWVANVLGIAPTVEFLGAITGFNYTQEYVLECGERISNIRQAFTVREGINLINREIPGRIIGRPPLTEGPLAGKSVDIEKRVAEYLKAMDWDVKTGKPGKEKLIQLGLGDVAAELWH